MITFENNYNYAYEKYQTESVQNCIISHGSLQNWTISDRIIYNLTIANIYSSNLKNRYCIWMWSASRINILNLRFAKKYYKIKKGWLKVVKIFRT